MVDQPPQIIPSLDALWSTWRVHMLQPLYINRINFLIAQNKDPVISRILGIICLRKYDNAAGECTSASNSLNAKDYLGFKLAGDAITDVGDTCETAFELKPSYSSQFRINNIKTQYFLVISLLFSPSL